MQIAMGHSFHSKSSNYLNHFKLEVFKLKSLWNKSSLNVCVCIWLNGYVQLCKWFPNYIEIRKSSKNICVCVFLSHSQCKIASFVNIRLRLTNILMSVSNLFNDPNAPKIHMINSLHVKLTTCFAFRIGFHFVVVLWAQF